MKTSNCGPVLIPAARSDCWGWYLFEDADVMAEVFEEDANHKTRAGASNLRKQCVALEWTSRSSALIPRGTHQASSIQHLLVWCKC
jgi:hypothetical protein